MSTQIQVVLSDKANYQLELYVLVNQLKDKRLGINHLLESLGLEIGVSKSKKNGVKE
jgi:hypothetical protein